MEHRQKQDFIYACKMGGEQGFLCDISGPGYQTAVGSLDHECIADKWYKRISYHQDQMLHVALCEGASHGSHGESE